MGQQWESLGRTVTEADVVNFAGLSGDFNPIHIDHEFARSTPFRQPIAHGLLVFSIGSGLGVSCPQMRTLAFVQVQEWNFKGPVFIGDTIHLRSKVLEFHNRMFNNSAHIGHNKFAILVDRSTKKAKAVLAAATVMLGVLCAWQLSPARAGFWGGRYGARSPSSVCSGQDKSLIQGTWHLASKESGGRLIPPEKGAKLVGDWIKVMR